MNIWEELNKTAELENENYPLADTRDPLMLEMAAVRGKRIPEEIADVNFSFYFSHKNSNHGIRVKVFWNRDRFKGDGDGFMELHGNYLYHQSSDKNSYKPKQYEVNSLRYFCKKFKVLFSAVWENVLSEDDLVDYFHGMINFKHLLSLFDIKNEVHYYKLNHCNNIEELESVVRQYNIFNMND